MSLVDKLGAQTSNKQAKLDTKLGIKLVSNLEKLDIYTLNKVSTKTRPQKISWLVRFITQVYKKNYSLYIDFSSYDLEDNNQDIKYIDDLLWRAQADFIPHHVLGDNLEPDMLKHGTPIVLASEVISPENITSVAVRENGVVLVKLLDISNFDGFIADNIFLDKLLGELILNSDFKIKRVAIILADFTGMKEGIELMELAEKLKSSLIDKSGITDAKDLAKFGVLQC